MILPGTLYQDPEWVRVRTFLGAATLAVFAGCRAEDDDSGALSLPMLRDPGRSREALIAYAVAMTDWIAGHSQQVPGCMRGNRRDDPVSHLAFLLVRFLCDQKPAAFEKVLDKNVRPGLQRMAAAGVPFWQAEPSTLRRPFNNLFSDLRDFADAAELARASGSEPAADSALELEAVYPGAERGQLRARVSANRIALYRCVDRHFNTLRHMFAHRTTMADRIALVLGVPVAEAADMRLPVMLRRTECKGHWILNLDREQGRWNASGKPGKFHSGKSFEGYRHQPGRIETLLAELDAYEAGERSIGNIEESDADRRRLAQALLDIGGQVVEDDGEEQLELPDTVPDRDGTADDWLPAEAELESLSGIEVEDEQDEEDEAGGIAARRGFGVVARPVAGLSGRHAENDEGVSEDDVRTLVVRNCLDRLQPPVRVGVMLKLVGREAFPQEWCDEATGLPPTEDVLAADLMVGERKGASKPTLRAYVERGAKQFDDCVRSGTRDLAHRP